MDASRLATAFDYEAFAKEMLDRQTFEHFQGPAVLRQPENISDYDRIKLRLLGLMSMATFKGTETTVLGHTVASPIFVGPLPPIADVKLALNVPDLKAGSAIKAVCDDLGFLCAVPLEQAHEVVRETPSKKPFLLYVVPDQTKFDEQAKLIKHVIQQLGPQVAGLVLECGYLPQQNDNDRLNRFSMPPRCQENSPAPWTSCKFSFHMIPYLREYVKRDLKIVIRGITSVDDALSAAEKGANAVWISEKAHLRSAASPISTVHNIAQTLASLHPSCEVILQGGARRGIDVLKAVALGAKAVCVDTDLLMWGLCRDGNSKGLQDLLSMLNEELKLAMVLTHSRCIAEVKADRVVEWIQPKSHQWRYRL